MTSDGRKPVPFVVEGDTDVPFARKVIEAAGGTPGTSYPQGGKAKLLQRIRAYANAARDQPWLALVDRDGDHECTPSAVAAWSVPDMYRLEFRVVVHAVECWAMADRAALAAHLRVRPALFPEDVESIEEPKRLLVELCRHSTSNKIRAAMVPTRRSGRATGRGYEGMLIEFAELRWDVNVARGRAPSLDRCIEALSRALRMNDVD